MTESGMVSIVIGSNRTYCFIRNSAGKLIFAPKSAFQDPEAMRKGANVIFRLSADQTGKKPRAEYVEAA